MALLAATVFAIGVAGCGGDKATASKGGSVSSEGTATIDGDVTFAGERGLTSGAGDRLAARL